MTYENEKLKNFNESLKSKKVAIIGLGVSNLPLLEYLYNNGAQITVFDKRDFDKLDEEAKKMIEKYNAQLSLGEEYLSRLVDFTYIFRSPSCMPDLPELKEAVENGAILTSEIEMLMELCPGTIVGVTGSDGKTTTTSLIYEIIKEKGINTYLGGNIGIPLFNKIKDMTPEDVVVLELSSFQLIDMKTSPHISVITNVTPNHLDIHKSYEEYINAKKAIFRYQDKEDILVLNYDNDITRGFADEAKSQVVFFSSKTKLDDGYIIENDTIKYCKDGIRRHLLDTKDILIRGRHNYENVATSIAATSSIVDIDTRGKSNKEV